MFISFKTRITKETKKQKNKKTKETKKEEEEEEEECLIHSSRKKDIKFAHTDD